MSEKGTVHIVREGAMLDGSGRYRAAFTIGDNPAEIESQRELQGESEVMRFLQHLLGREAKDVRGYVDELRRNGRVRIPDVDDQRYRGNLAA